ncbi:hypothetical protein [Leifsonia sp. Leaf264]|uniref:hypothetical protein n=1 Tax=Leifsonia sp. Leaf264 TaxID=1736314 RepID=UPI00070000B6|nr:hypothetical protein [Leifsonia sp. Leaf264]KQO98601.1 hypothetical protein ASF30_11100 [Leifsonia sp. Leaf264]
MDSTELEYKAKWRNNRTGRTYFINAWHDTDGGFIQLLSDAEPQMLHWLTIKGFRRDYRPVTDENEASA